MITVFCSDLEEFKRLPYNMLDTADVLYIDGTVVKSPTMPLKFQELVKPSVETRVAKLEQQMQHIRLKVFTNTPWPVSPEDKR